MANPTRKVTPLFALSLLQTTLYFYLLSFSLFQHSTLAKSNTYNVVDFGAKPDGKTDCTKALLVAWNKACGSPRPSSIYVPQGKFLVGTATFSGQCANKAISITINGTLVAPSYYGYDARYWLTFDQVSGVSIHGGLLDGQGSSLWECKNSGKTKCPVGVGAATLGFSNANNIVITGLTSINSQMFHIVINGCQNVKVHGVKIMAAGNSPNTDGIHVQFSSDVTILKPRIHTGDDCISVGPGTRNLWIEDVACGPGHGIRLT